MIDESDGFAAARILAPRIQEKMGEVLGFPFFFAVPNRDFLCCWSRSLPAHAQVQLRLNVVKDYHTRSHNLSPNVYQVLRPGTIVSTDSDEKIAYRPWPPKQQSKGRKRF